MGGNCGKNARKVKVQPDVRQSARPVNNGSATVTAAVQQSSSPINRVSSPVSQSSLLPSAREEISIASRSSTAEAQLTAPETLSKDDEHYDGDEIKNIGLTSSMNPLEKKEGRPMSNRGEPKSRTPSHKSSALPREKSNHHSEHVPSAKAHGDDVKHFCEYCNHCRKFRRGIESPRPLWITRDDVISDELIIDLNEYDDVAYKEKTINTYGPKAGNYDFAPHLTIQPVKDSEQTVESYIKQESVANTKSAVIPMHTPYPNYDEMQRKDWWFDKPFSDKLFTL